MSNIALRGGDCGKSKDPEKCQKKIFAPLPAVFLEDLLTKLSKA